MPPLGLSRLNKSAALTLENAALDVTHRAHEPKAPDGGFRILGNVARRSFDKLPSTVCKTRRHIGQEANIHRQPRPQKSARASGSTMAVSTPLSAIPRLENAPATSLIWSARAVPIP